MGRPPISPRDGRAYSLPESGTTGAVITEILTYGRRRVNRQAVGDSLARRADQDSVDRTPLRSTAAELRRLQSQKGRTGWHRISNRSMLSDGVLT